MTTPAQVDANRRNARKSTGPRTAEGKARSATNALRHGGFARADVITASILGEDHDEVQALIDAIVDELDPQTPLEQIAANTVATRILNRTRVDRLTAPLAEGTAPVGGRSIDIGSKRFQYGYAADLYFALDSLERDSEDDSDAEFDWSWLFNRLRTLRSSGPGFDIVQSSP